MFSRDLPLTWEVFQIEERNHILQGKGNWRDSLSFEMENVVRKLVWSKGILLLVRDAASMFNWFAQSFIR